MYFFSDPLSIILDFPEKAMPFLSDPRETAKYKNSVRGYAAGRSQKGHCLLILQFLQGCRCQESDPHRE